MSRKVTITEFIMRANRIHNSKYDYAQVELQSVGSHIKIGCPQHGMFTQLAQNHLRGLGCIKCTTIYSPTLQEWKTRAEQIHGDKYDYSKVQYVNNRTKIIIGCHKHGDFQKIPAAHTLKKHGCPKCTKLYRPSTQEWIARAQTLYGDKYDYSLVNYVNALTKVTIICKTHGNFSRTPNDHINGHQGCRLCNESKGELAIARCLESHNISYVREKTFTDCRNQRPLPYDFYIPSHNLLIEYDGEQHFHPVRFPSQSKKTAEVQFKKTCINDKIKTEFAVTKGICLLRIPYGNLHQIPALISCTLEDK